MGFEVVCCVALGDSQVYNHLMPVARNPLISKIWIIRHRKSDTGQIPKAEYILVSDKCKPLRWLQMRKHCMMLARRKEVKAFISFNPLPYGVIAGTAAKKYNKDIHYGFIGSDWHRTVKSKFGRYLLPMLKKASFVTVTGDQMLRDLLNEGFDENKTQILPNSIDLEQYPVANQQADYDCIFVGRLVNVKRVDLILKAFEILNKTHSQAKLCIVGDGPLKESLEKKSTESGLDNTVDFVGQTKDVSGYLAKSKIILIASDSEGFPFSLVEGMCCGLVPVSTPVGTITEHIEDGVNGLLFPCGNAEAMAGCIAKLLDNKDLYEQIRGKTLLLRNEFSYEKASLVWDNWFKMISSSEPSFPG